MNLGCFGLHCLQPAESNPKTKESRTILIPTLKTKWWSKPLLPALKSAKSSSLAAMAFTPLFLYTDPSGFLISTVHGLKWISCPGSRHGFTGSPFALYHSFRSMFQQPASSSSHREPSRLESANRRYKTSPVTWGETKAASTRTAPVWFSCSGKAQKRYRPAD